jgi:hypothetical protein
MKLGSNLLQQKIMPFYQKVEALMNNINFEIAKTGVAFDWLIFLQF